MSKLPEAGAAAVTWGSEPLRIHPSPFHPTPAGSMSFEQGPCHFPRFMWSRPVLRVGPPAEEELNK